MVTANERSYTFSYDPLIRLTAAKYGKKEEYTNYKIALILENIVIRDPVGGIEAGHKQLQKLIEKNRSDEEGLEAKLEAFSKRAIDYYQKKGIIRS